ncbi:MAG: trigger factor, partial [Alphaproteobacteria bacterium]
MQVTETLSEGLRREFKIVIPGDDIRQKVEQRLTELATTTHLRGFRPGKAPLSLIRQRFGPSIRGEIVESTVSECSQKAVADKALKPASQPRIEITSFADDGDLECALTMEIMPEFEPVDPTSLALARRTAPVSAERVDDAVRQFAERNLEPAPVTEARPVQAGDFVIVDYSGEVDGESVTNGEITDAQLDLSSEFLLPGFADQVIGQSVGATVAFTLPLPESYPRAELVGKPASFKLTVKEIRQRDPIVLNEDLAKSLGMESLEALRSIARDSLTQEHANATRSQLKQQVLDQLAEARDFDVPPSMLDEEFAGIWRQIEQARDSGTLEPDDAAKSEEELKQEYRAIAARRVRLGLLLADFGRRQDVEVTQEELNSAIMRQASAFPGQEARLFEWMRENPEALGRLHAPLDEDQVVDALIEQATVTDETVSPEELFGMPGDAARPAGRKPAAKKPAAKSTTAKKTTAKAPAAKKATAKKTATKTVAKKASTKKAVAKAPAGKSAAKKSTAKKKTA